MSQVSLEERAALLEKRLASLEQRFQELHQFITSKQTEKGWDSTYGMFAGDDEFEEILRLGREYRQQQNEVSHQ